MENKENKLIADKINSLDKLPQGYNPNLDAKWALLQSEEKEQPVLTLFLKQNWRKIAAVILILFLSSALWISKFSSSTNEISTQPIHEIAIPAPVHQNLPLAESQKPIEKQIVEIKNLQKRPGKKINSKVRQEEISIEKQIPVQDKNIEIQLPVEEKALATSEIKRSKQRYVQMDFDDAVVKDSNKNTFAQGFQFRLGIKNLQPTNQNSDNNTNFKLKRNF
ncbi:MAG: hypothetical protein IPP27_03380 [Bacteroidetes bacterium]|nr:hypothetical protein [Bacteroidota bacterium]